jgi:O-antigen/teichoic acid export membrane protein
LWLAGNVASALYLLVAYRLRVGKLGLTLDLRLWGTLMKSSLPLGAGTILSQVYMNFGLLMLGVLAIGEPAGWFTAAQRLVYFVLVIDRAFYMVAFPIISRRLADTDNAECGMQNSEFRDRHSAFRNPVQPGAQETMQHLAKLVLLVTVPIAVCALPLAGTLMSAVYGPEYLPAAPVLAVMVWLVVTTTLNSLYAYGLVAAGREPRYARNISIGTTAVLALSLVLVLLFNALGAAIALVVGETLMLALMFTDFRRVLRVGFLRYLWRPLAVAGALAGGIRLIGPERLAQWLGPAALSARRQEQVALLAVVVLAIAIYFGIMYLVGGVGRKEFALLRSSRTDPGQGSGQDDTPPKEEANREDTPDKT